MARNAKLFGGGTPVPPRPDGALIAKAGAGLLLPTDALEPAAKSAQGCT